MALESSSRTDLAWSAPGCVMALARVDLLDQGPAPTAMATTFFSRMSKQMLEPSR